jgi:hypothetical protein
MSIPVLPRCTIEVEIEVEEVVEMDVILIFGLDEPAMLLDSGPYPSPV